ncbi:hypothetical protein LOZ37_003333 [Ophidiomyces ophidiicola]|nr:hypothetical protein LOZ37_003333 [Ophidiomyces ophidiicola]
MGIQLKRVEVIADDEDEIVEAVRRMSDKYDFVVTSGGIGPTYEMRKLTTRRGGGASMTGTTRYQSIAKAFNLELKFHEAAFARMKRLSKPEQAKPDFDWDTPSATLTARLRMVHIPTDATRPLAEQSLFVDDDLWIPVSIVHGNVYILPGVPSLFERLLLRLKPVLLPKLIDPEGKGIHRFLFATPLYESTVAPYLTELAERVAPRGLKVGSYPRWGKKRNTVTLVGTDLEYMESLVGEIEKNVQGRRVMKEDEDDDVDAPNGEK